MENTKIFLENGIETDVSGLFYIFKSKYYFIYTAGEIDENNYVKLYVVQVCKEIQNTPTGPVDTGYMLGMEIPNLEEWKKVQTSITKIVEDKKNNTVNSEIQYLPISMLTNLKIINKNKFKLMKNVMKDNFKVNIGMMEELISQGNKEDFTTTVPFTYQKSDDLISSVDLNGSLASLTNLDTTQKEELKNKNDNDVIIDYRSRFFEEQEKNNILREELNRTNQKLEQIKNIIG